MASWNGTINVYRLNSLFLIKLSEGAEISHFDFFIFSPNESIYQIMQPWIQMPTNLLVNSQFHDYFTYKSFSYVWLSIYCYQIDEFSNFANNNPKFKLFEPDELILT